MNPYHLILTGAILAYALHFLVRSTAAHDRALYRILGAMALLIALYLVTSTGMISDALPHLPRSWAARGQYVSLFLLPGLYYQFLLRLFPEETSIKFGIGLGLLSGTGALFAGLAPTPLLSLSGAPAALVLILAAAAILNAVPKCVRARRMGAVPIGLAFIANVIFCANDALVFEGAIDGIELMPLGYLVLMFAHGLVMGAKREHAVLDRGQALTESERRVRMLTDNLPVVLFQIAAEPRGQFRTLYVSHGIERLIGQDEIGPGDALLAFRDLVIPSDRPALDAFGRRAALRDEPTETTVRVVMPNGESRWVHVLARRRRLADGQILLDGLLSDVTGSKEMEARLRESAITDDLTGTFNRRHFLGLARREFNRARRFSHPLSVLLIDADHFKQVNDRYGHAAGDRCLGALGQALKSNLRDVDVLGRLGGEEFGAILPETPIDRAVAAAERLRKAVARLRIEYEQHIIEITVSIGVVGYERRDEDLETLLGYADAAMYDAKSQGRDRVVLADSKRTTGVAG